jgi:sigma-B regulation protein RsbU (phosphoserine phosphatase)
MTPIYDDNGTMTALIGIQRDVTEHKKMVEALRKSNERFEMLTKQSRVIAWEIDTEGLITYCSDGALEVLGYSPEEIVGHMRFIDFVRPDLKQEYARKTSQVLRKNENFTNFYYPAMTKTGGTVHMTVNGMRSFDEQGSVICYRGVNIDITEKTEMEQMIENEKERYRTTLLSVGDGVISTDHQGNITVMNPVAEKLTGWTQETQSGNP